MSHAIEPFTIGFLYEGLFRAYGDEQERLELELLEPIRFRFMEATASGELDRPVNVIVSSGQGLPYGTARAVQDAWLQLAESGALAIIGPGITDNCIAVRSFFEAHRVPTINFPGTTRSRGEYGFHYQIGSLYDDGPLVARAIGAAGHGRVSVIRDRSPIGDELFQHFALQCERSDIVVVADVRVSPVRGDEMDHAAERASAPLPDALVYLGLGRVLLDLSRVLTAQGWDPPRFAGSAGMGWHFRDPSQRREMSGWVYVDQVDEDNPTLRAFQDKFEDEHGRRPFTPFSVGGYDMATLVVLALRAATLHTPEGVKEGLERINLVPSALGGPGTVLGFGPWERTALKGAHYLVLRQMSGDRTTKYRGG